MPAPIDLITLAELTAAWPQSSALDSGDLAALLTAASRRFESECDRVLGANTYMEVHRPGRTRKLYLRQKPVTSVTRVAADFLTVLTLQNTDTTVFEATVGFTGPTVPEQYLTATGLTLNAIAAGVPATPVTLLFATYPTLALLAAAVNALPGWLAVVTSPPSGTTAPFTTFPSAYLAFDVGQQGAAAPYLACLKAYTRALQYACDPELARKGTVELFEGEPDGFRYPDRRYGTALYGSGYGVGPIDGTDPRIGAVAVSYAAGYPVADVPEDIKRAVITTARFLHSMAVGAGIYQSQTFKDYSYSKLAVVELPKDVRVTAFNHSRKEWF